MEVQTSPPVGQSMVGPPRGGGFRGRGGTLMRGGFERGRGRGIGRGHFMGAMNRGMGGPPPPHGMMTGGPRGMRPRGIAGGGFQTRGGFQPRGAPMGMRGGRPPVYQQQPKQHTGSDNNKTVSPVPASTGADQSTTDTVIEETLTTTATTAAAAGTATSSANGSQPTANTTQVASTQPSNGNAGPTTPQYTRPPRGRGGSYARGGGRGGYNPHMNGSGGSAGSNMYSGPHHAGPGGPSVEHVQMPPRRGALRGRGGYGQGIPRPPIHQAHNVNTQIAPVAAIKRGAPGGPGPKRGRYESGPYSQRPMAPKYHTQPQHMGAMPPQQSYGPPINHHPPAQSHHGYPQHDQSQLDPYAQAGYNTPATQTAYNGYGQSSSYTTHATQASAPAGSGYATHHGTEYDQSQYQSYNSAGYAAQDTRYQSYGQDYTQQYGAAALDYNTSAQADYSQQSAPYDERAYAGYDAQGYQQNYSNPAAYY